MSLASQANPSTTKISSLLDRAFMLRSARDFFFKKNIIEVDCPHITKYSSVDTAIDLIPIKYLEKETRYLHSSPEYGMKRLLSLGMGDIYQLAHVFRNEGFGSKHNPEFMMAEWYRMNFNLDQMIEETTEFIRLFLGELPSSKLSYREAFLKYAQVDYLKAPIEELLDCLNRHQIPLYKEVLNEGKEALLNLILGSVIEKELGKGEILILYHYPATQSALAKTSWKGEEEVAERFEIYVEGIELCNGYHELQESELLLQRLLKSNEERLLLGKEMLPIDQHFLEAQKKGIPDCAGVAVGVDRLMMLRHQSKNIHQSMTFGWEEA